MVVSRCDFNIGEYIDGRYCVTRHLGEGSFGNVFLVEDSSKHTFALKLLKLWEVPPDIRTALTNRFEMEYQTGRIDCPYLVQSLNRGMVEGNPYIVMEYCPNGDLTQYVGNNWVKIGQDILLGLKALHTRGKVHRDLKPENVLIKANGTAALTDFGISGDRNKRMTERNILGKPMQIFGTYAYMPPEQVKPRNGDATVLPTTDIFSFGVMMYQMLTGNLPFGSLNNHNDLANYVSNADKGVWNRSALDRSTSGMHYKSVIEGCLIPDFRSRLQSVDEVLKLMPARVSQEQDVAYQKPTHITGYLLRIMQGEEYGKTYNITNILRDKNIVTMGRNDVGVSNTIAIQEQQSCYISRRHCTLEYDVASRTWYIRDGQWDKNSTLGWKTSLNGTFVNSKEVNKNGYYLEVGDIISIGDTKLRFEAY